MGETGIVTSVQSMCWDDGQGLRTTVFLKGCPLRCFWCHNPESLRPEPEFLWYEAKCTRCGLCAAACPTGARPTAGGFPDGMRCTRCGACAEVCPRDALELAGRPAEAESLAEELSADRAFFDASGGGVTLSGGEPLLQWRFTLDLLGALRRRGIHTAVETCGHAPREVFDRVTAAADLVLMDLKHPDPEVHRRITGVTNDRILENFRALAASGKPCILRTPVIPGVNDDEAAVSRLAGLAAKARGLVRYELLPYHPLGTGKLRSLGRNEDEVRILPPPDGAKMGRLRSLAAAVIAREGGE